MGLKERLGKRVRQVVARFSGEYSAVAPEETIPYARNLGEDPDRKVVRAKLHRPPPTKAGAGEDAAG